MKHNPTKDQVQLLMYCLTHGTTPSGGLLYKEAIAALNFDSSPESLLSVSKLLSGLKRRQIASADLIVSTEGTNFLCMLSAYLGKLIEIHTDKHIASTLLWSDHARVLEADTIQSPSALDSLKISYGSSHFEPMRVIAHYLDDVTDTPIDEQVLGFIRLLSSKNTLDKTSSILSSSANNMKVDHSSNRINLSDNQRDSQPQRHHIKPVEVKETKTEVIHQANISSEVNQFQQTTPAKGNASAQHSQTIQEQPSKSLSTHHNFPVEAAHLLQLAHDIELVDPQQQNQLAPTISESNLNIKVLETQAEQGQCRAMLKLALYHFDYLKPDLTQEASVTEKSIDTGLQFVEKAATLNSAPAHYFLSQVYKSGWRTIEASPERYAQHLKEASTLSHPVALKEIVLNAKQNIKLEQPKAEWLDDRLKRPLIVVVACIVGMLIFF